jgi:hypothetical protein
MALLPLHVHLAGRVMADSPLGLLVTMTFVLLLEAELRNHRALYLLGGVCAGFVFWIKEVAIIFVIVPAVWACVRRRNVTGWMWAMGAMATVVAANFAAMWLLSGDPLHLVHAIVGSMKRYENVAQMQWTNDDRSALFYLRYLFVDVWHTWVLGYLALFGAVGALLRFRRSPRSEGVDFLLLWAIGLVGVFSLFVVSASPIRLIPKQTNYMTIFFAPLCLLGGMAIAAIGNVAARAAILGAYAAGALLLCALEQVTIDTFTANSRSTLAFAAAHPDSSIYVMTNAERLNLWASMLRGSGVTPVHNLRSMSDLFDRNKRARPRSDQESFAVVDSQTIDWGSNGIRSVKQIPVCWQKGAMLPARDDPSAGRYVTHLAIRASRAIPAAIGERIAVRLERQLTALPAEIYRVPFNCG